MTDKKTVKQSGAVTFKALLSPKQTFSFKEGNYHFLSGYFTTENLELIAYLEHNPSCERLQ